VKRAVVTLDLLAVLTLSGAVGCSETPNVDRRLAYVNQHAELPPDKRAAIAEGRVQIGMTMEEVRAMVGDPIHVTRRERHGPNGKIQVEVWIYPGPVVRPSVMKSAANSEFLARLTFENGVLKEIREI
jgi:hypothetical protein